jgi:ribose transport system substrate-binding protein
MHKTLSLIAVLVFAFAALSCTKAEAPNGAKKLTIAVIPKGTTHEFWKSIHAGSLKAAGELSALGTVVEEVRKSRLR